MSGYDFLIIGSGLTGAVLARELSNAGAKCIIVEKRDKIGGNICDSEVEGVIIHDHGPHIFHTNSQYIWKYVNTFSNWTPYEHRVKAVYRDKVYSFPPNLMTFQQLGVNPDDQKLNQVLYDTFFCGYSMKQWGRPVNDIPSKILKRIPIRYDYDDRYFSDRYQGLPSNGYTRFIRNIVNGIDYELKVDYLTNRSELNNLAVRIIYTGMIDAFYDYKFGALDYRSLKFETIATDDDCWGAATFNYTDFTPEYTRAHNWRYFGYQPVNRNIITREYPENYNGANEPYYPVNDEQNNEKYKQYKRLADSEGVIVAGRLGRYQYYNMDQAIGAALAISKGLIANA